MKKTQTKTSNDEMNVIWQKEKLLKFSKESIVSPNVASGDGCTELNCRLCGASNHLQLITNNRLDETLRLYFGVQVPPEGVICESCIKCMKITEGFSALVHASFDKSVSDCEDSSEITKVRGRYSPEATDQLATNPPKEILSLLKTKLGLETTRKRRIVRKKSITNVNSKTVFKKAIMACSVCSQKYPMRVSSDSVKIFICSRCQKNEKSRDFKNNNTPLSVNRVELRCKSNLKGRNRLNILPKTPQHVKENQSATKCTYLAKHQCDQCPKKYAKAENLATHIKAAHGAGGSSDLTCSICGKKIKSKECLEKHLGEHGEVNIFQCGECKRVFKSKRALQAHSMAYDQLNKKCFSS